MKLKKIFIVLLLIILCIGCASAVSAYSDVDNNMSKIDDSNINLGDIVDTEDIDSTVLREASVETDNSKLGVDNNDDNVLKLSPYKQFCNDLEENSGTIYLDEDIKITSPFIITEKTVIDGKGHTIDAQHKTHIFENYAPLTLKNIILKNGKSKTGGAILAVHGNLYVNKCEFIDNIATECGGAIFSIGKLTIKDSTFTGNSAKDTGGAVYITKGHLSITNSKFKNNYIESGKSVGYGGALGILKSSSQITGTTFKSNGCISKSLKSHSKATKYKFNGGAIAYSDGTSHYLTDCTFYGNKASTHGGSIFVARTNSLKINKCNFNKNRAVYEDGGAISFAGKKMAVTNTKFTNNLAFEDGGAIDSYSMTGKKIYITIKKSTFESNTAYKCAGAIWMGVKTGYTIENSKFIKNKATNAGAIEAESGTTKITKCTFKSNKAAKITSWVVKTKSGARLSHCGGAIVIKNSCTITKSTFQGNKATYGNSVKVEGGKLTSKGNKGIK